jgi:MoaA/NifB/PqqE/SkfB family radical SAM enzyme
MSEVQDNIALSEREIAARQIRLESRPRLLMLVLTNACNLSCIMCGRARAGRTVTLPLAAARKVAPLFPCLEAIDWQGGETFMVPYFKELFQEAARFPGIRHSIITNGLLLDREWAELVARTGTSLTFSVDAVTKATYERIRQGGELERLRANLRLVREVRGDGAPSHHVNVVVMRSNHRELELFPAFCAEHGIGHLRFDFLRPDTAPEEDILLRRDPAAAALLREALPRIRAACAAAGIRFECTFEGLLREGAAEAQPARAGSCANSCKLPWKKLCVDACRDGAVLPDCLCRRGAGDINAGDLLELWNGAGMRRYREALAAGRAAELCSPDCLSGAVDESHFEGKA